MKFNTKEKNSILLLIELARNYHKDKFINLKTISKSIKKSEKYLAQLVSPLVASGIILSSAGPRGGLVLKKDPHDIKLNDILESISGRMDLVECVNSPKLCQSSESCKLRNIFIEISGVFLKTLNSYTLEDLKNGKTINN